MKIELSRDVLDEAGQRPESSSGMSNFDHSVDDGLADELRSGKRAQHSAWDFCGTVWFDANTGQFIEVVRRFHSVVAAYSAEGLDALMQEVNDDWGWE